MHYFAPALVLLLAATAHAADSPPALRVSADFPGGSARVEQIDQAGRTIRLLPAPHRDRGWVCWWYCKVEGIKPGETLTLDVGGGVWATPDRAAFSLDDKVWHHTEPGKRTKDRIIYRQKIDAKEAWFAWGPPFVLRHAQELVERVAKQGAHVRAFELCKSKEGHPVPALRVEQPGAKDGERLGVWMQARQHAWESGSSWVCHGFVDWLLSDDPRAVALRKTATVTIIPIMDVDNVERGAGGKNQKPHDHNRDWGAKAVWPEVQAAMKEIAAQSAAGRLDVFVDLHNPGAGDRQPFFFVPPPELLSAQGRQNLDAFLTAARREIAGPLKLAAKPRASGAAYDPAWERISKNWVARHSQGRAVAVTLETSWNTPHSTQANYQRVGKELGLAIERYLRDAPQPRPDEQPRGGVLTPGQAAKPLRVLLLSGVPETHHDYKNQCPNMQKALQQQGHDVVLRDKAIVEEGDAARFDVLVLMSEKWRGDEQNRQELLRLVRDGKGLVVIHMGYVPCVEALGGKASRNGKTGDLKVEIVDRKHSITAGLEDFTAGPKDELYAGVKFTADDVRVLARGQDSLGTWEPVAWVRPYGQGRVFYTSLGHSTPSQQNPSFLKLVTSAVRWAGAGKGRP